jgi:predicted phosphohydrolase
MPQEAAHVRSITKLSASTMKLAIASDLHLPITPATIIWRLAREIDTYGPDALVLAGDVAESLAELEQCLAIFRGVVTCPVLVLAGNHDLWCRDASSRRKWEELLPDAVRRAGCVWLENEPFVKDGVAVAGSVAWYDYSGADPAIKASARAFADNKRFYNMDAQFIDWPWSDIEFAEKVGGAFLATIDRLESDEGVKQVVVVTHVPILECQMCRDSGNPDWAFSNAYFGNLTLGAKVLARRKVTHVISCHTHVGRTPTSVLRGRPKNRGARLR